MKLQSANSKDRRAEVKATAWALVVELVPVISSVVFFFVLVNYISPDDYGIMTAATALGLMSIPLSTFGAGTVMWRSIGSTNDRSGAWSKAFSVTLVGPLIVLVLLLALRPLLLSQVGLWTFALLLFQQMTVFILTDLAVFYLISVGAVRTAAVSRLIFAAFRLAAVYFFVAFADHTLESLAQVLACFGLASLLAVLWHLRRSQGLAMVPRRVARSELLEGVPDALGVSANGLLNVSDRPLLVGFGFEADGGRYAVGNRLALLGNIPLLAILRTFDQRLTVAGAKSRQDGWELTTSVMKRTVPVSLIVSATALALTPLLSLLLPEQYGGAIDIVRVMLILPVLRSVQYPIGNLLTVGGDRAIRAWITFAALVGNFLANLVLIPHFSWKAAAGTTIAAELMMTVAFYVVLKRRLGRAR
ncbi:MAG: polysaccharide biosynthesis C-terminal domain-containing protein [Acidimicrobiales bacterium]